MKLIKMKNEEKGIKADVHPDMVKDYETGGYAIIEEEKKNSKKASKKGKK